MQGLYQSEPKSYFRDQKEFRHYLLFDGAGGVRTVSGNFQPEEAINYLTKSTKSINGEVNASLLKNTATLKWLSSGKAPLPDNSNIHQAIISIIQRANELEVKCLDRNDYHEFSGTYLKVELPQGHNKA